MTAQEVLDSVLRLSESERLLIAGRILDTLPDPMDSSHLNEDEFLEELLKRSDDWQGAVSWSELTSSLQNEP